jgi:hypothetical protein
MTMEMPLDPPEVYQDADACDALDIIAQEAFEIARDHGFWERTMEEYNTNAEKCTAIMLMVTELSESVEALRAGSPDDKLPQYPGEWVELADCFIRIANYCGARGIPLGEVTRAKMEYNKSRPYKHGKKF